MKQLWLLALIMTSFSCVTSEPSLCGDGDELRADGTSACVYRSALVGDRFECPPEVAVRTDLVDGAVLCSENEALPSELAEQLEAEGYEGPVGGTPWTIEDAPPNTPRPVGWIVGELKDLEINQPLQNARVCLMDVDPEVCIMTDGYGQFALNVIDDTNLAITAELDGYYPMIVPLPPFGPPGQSPQRIMLDGLEMRPVGAETGLLETIGATQRPDFGLLALCVDAEDVVLTVDDRAEEAWYIEEDKLIRSPTGTTTPDSHARFPNLSPGEYSVSATSANGCRAQGWPGAVENSMRVPIRAGFMTSALLFDCD